MGDVDAAGRTVTQLAEAIAEKLREFIENQQVSIKEVNSYAIYVLGEVSKPGKYPFPLKSKPMLLQVITLAGGFASAVARNKIVVFRFEDQGGGGC